MGCDNARRVLAVQHQVNELKSHICSHYWQDLLTNGDENVTRSHQVGDSTPKLLLCCFLFFKVSFGISWLMISAAHSLFTLQLSSLDQDRNIHHLAQDILGTLSWQYLCQCLVSIMLDEKLPLSCQNNYSELLVSPQFGDERKMIIFFATQDMVDFHTALFSKVLSR